MSGLLLASALAAAASKPMTSRPSFSDYLLLLNRYHHWMHSAYADTRLFLAMDGVIQWQPLSTYNGKQLGRVGQGVL